MIDDNSGMMVRHYQHGEVLDVAGLNQITVLIDRSRTALTEIGWNVWHAGLEGPPHFHDAKEQLFYITNGTGTITVGNTSYRVGPDHLIHVPVGAMHRTEVDPGEPLAYLLYNAFKDAHKEGHATFADHIGEAKHERRRQADAATCGATIDWSRVDTPGAHIVVAEGQAAGGVSTVHTLVEPPATQRCIVDRICQPAGAEYILRRLPHGERSLFVTRGSALLVTAGESAPLSPGDVAFLPAHLAGILNIESDPFCCLCFTTMLP